MMLWPASASIMPKAVMISAVYMNACSHLAVFGAAVKYMGTCQNTADNSTLTVIQNITCNLW